ncbi:MAG TPA: hypothetical protein VLW53_04160, partial [Candidatus Eisenbacteria bacterium]|nr:hypothetical protein [Candidatus Eisenbacteria bacterium]
QRLEGEMAGVRRDAAEEVTRVRETARAVVAAAEAEVLRVTEVQEGLRAQLQVMDRELQEQRERGALLEQRLRDGDADQRRQAAEHAGRLEALHAQLHAAEAALAAEREARLGAEAQARAAVALAGERARERDRLLDARQVGVRRRRARSRRPAAEPDGGRHAGEPE